MTGNDVTWQEVTGIDAQVTLFERKSPGSGCRRPVTQVLCTFELLHGFKSQEVAVTRQEITSRASRARKCPEVTSFGLKSPGK